LSLQGKEINVLEAAESLSVNQTTVRNYLRKGLIRGVKIGHKWRISENSLRSFRRPFYTRNIPQLDEKVKMTVAWTVSAEGTISINARHSVSPHSHRFRACPIICVSNTEKEFITRFWSLVVVGGIYLHKRLKSGKNVWTWSLRSVLGCYTLLSEIKEYLPIKREQADLVIKFCESRLRHLNKPYTDYEIALIKQVRFLNSKKYNARRLSMDSLDYKGRIIRGNSK